MARRRSQANTTQPGEWNFFTFPSAFMFFVGLLVAPIFYGVFGGLFVWVVIFCVSFGVAHIIGHTWRRRTLDRQLAQAEDDERDRRAYAARQASNLEAEAESHSARRRRRRR